MKLYNNDGYDGLLHLSSESRAGAAGYTALYAVDGAGNRTASTVGGVTTIYAYDADDELKNTSGGFANTYGYNANGDQTTRTVGGTSYTLAYDYDDHLTSTGGSSFAYDAQGRRVSRTAGGVTTRFLFDGGSIVLEKQGSATTATYTYGNALIRKDGETPLFDGLGSERTVTNGSGAVQGTLTLSAFGQTVASTGSSTSAYQYGATSGYRSEGDTGLLLLGHRYYDASVGRFLTADPAKAGGNWYVYCQNDPVNEDDPSGYQSTLDTPAGAAEIAQASPEELATLGRTTAPKPPPTYPGDIPPDTPVYRGGGTSPGELTPRPGKDDAGLSFNLNPTPSSSGTNVTTTVQNLVNNGFKAVNDWGDHVLVSIEDMGSWVGDRGSDATRLLKTIVTKIKVDL